MMQMSRRNLLAGFAATGAFALIDTPALAAAKPFFQRVGLPIGLQLYTLGDEAGRDLDATFAEVARIGYRDIELPGLYNRKPEEVRAAATRAGLTITSLHVPPAPFGGGAGLSLKSDPAVLVETLGALGVKRAVAPIMLFPDNFRPAAGENPQETLGRTIGEAGADLWKRTAALLNERAALLKPQGISVGYHNHNVEFAPIGETSGWDILWAETDPALIHFEIDTGWIATAGLDPAAFLRRHRGRVQQLHVKDVAAGNTTNFTLSMKPAEVGSGTIDWKRVLPAAYEAGVRNFYVEQEPPFTLPRIEAARKSHDFLAQLTA